MFQGLHDRSGCAGVLDGMRAVESVFEPGKHRLGTVRSRTLHSEQEVLDVVGNGNISLGPDILLGPANAGRMVAASVNTQYCYVADIIGQRYSGSMKWTAG